MATCAPRAIGFASNASGLRIRLNVTDTLLGIALVWAMVPETLIGDFYIYDIPLRFSLFYASVVSCAISTLTFGLSKVTLYFKVALSAMLFMAVTSGRSVCSRYAGSADALEIADILRGWVQTPLLSLMSPTARCT